MADNKKALELLFQRPLEPIFASRDNGKTAFVLHESYYDDHYDRSKIEQINALGTSDVTLKIPLDELSVKPNLVFAQKLGRKVPFSLFIDQHLEIAGKLIQMFLDASDTTELLKLCAYTKDRVNPVLFQYCYSVAIGHRKDTNNIRIPPIAETFPNNFVEPSILNDARTEGLLLKCDKKICINIPLNYTANEREEEQRLAYFREDIGVNMHHWHWHLTYPARGPMEVVNKDRRGELFYYMHHQMIARYNVERFCNNLKGVMPLNDLRKRMPEAYFPKLTNSVNSRTYPSRHPNAVLNDLYREDNKIDIADVERWKDRICEAIDLGFIKDAAGKQHPLDAVKGIDLLGNIVEASAISKNPQYYGNVHNMGHDLIAFCHDSENKYLEKLGVMGDITTACRDPIFYRWHEYIDKLFNRHKALLAPYNASHLRYASIKINSIEAQVSNPDNTPVNTLLTYWQKSTVDLTSGLDFRSKGAVIATFTHLQHAPFEYTIKATNGSRNLKQGTCRIFICPKYDERSTPLTLEETRILAIELDKFFVELKPGQNTIGRRSDKSTVTIPFRRTFPDVDGDDDSKTSDHDIDRICACGWPEYLLLPKGNAEGVPFELFVMISDYAGDAVTQPDDNPIICAEGASFCGLKDKLYPDKRNMGYPFDRRLPGDSLTTLTSSFSNMMKIEVKIIFNDKVVERT